MRWVAADRQSPGCEGPDGVLVRTIQNGGGLENSIHAPPSGCRSLRRDA